MSGLAEISRYEVRVAVAADLIRDEHIYNLAAADFAKAIRLPVETILALA